MLHSAGVAGAVALRLCGNRANVTSLGVFANIHTEPVLLSSVSIYDVNMSSRWPSSMGMLHWVATATVGRC